jgi:hypothetical protein
MMGIATSDLQTSIWARAKTLESFTTLELAELGISEATARDYCRRWLRKGHIRLAGKGKNGRLIYAPNKRPALDQDGQPIVPTPEGNMWRAMRLLSQFSPTDIAAHANAGGITVDVKAAQAYCRDLLTAGYLTVRVKAKPPKREAVYALVNNTGPAAPVHRRIAGVLDPNTESFIPNLKENMPWQRF